MNMIMKITINDEKKYIQCPSCKFNYTEKLWNSVNNSKFREENFKRCPNSLCKNN